MIFQFVIDRLSCVEGLSENLFPTGVDISEIYTTDNDFFFSVYTFHKRTPVYDLKGDLHHYAEEIMIDFVGRMYDRLHAVYDAVEAAFHVNNVFTGTGEYVFSVQCSSPQPDAFDVDCGLIRRTMLVSMDWCPT